MSSDPVYMAEIFDQPDLASARTIVLTPEDGFSTEDRWNDETPWLMQQILSRIDTGGLIVDYGCGVGRVASALVEQGASVVGVDISSHMRAHATRQVSDDKRFVAVTPEMMDRLASAGLQADALMAIWVLQHCFDMIKEVQRIRRLLKRDGLLMVADMNHRALPTNQGWMHDGQSTWECLNQHFTLVQRLPFDPPRAPANLRLNAYLAFFKNSNP